MSNYAGITIGPIVDTLMLAKSPAAMWYASSMFSSLTEDMCERISADGSMQILSPHYEKRDETKPYDGIGKYHDRIIVKNADESKIKEIIDESKKAAARSVARDLDAPDDNAAIDFVTNYLQAHYVYLPGFDENDNAILEIGYLLDCLEQMPSPNADNTSNPFIRLFKGEEDFRNKYVRNKLDSIAKNSRLKNTEGNLKSISEIAGQGKQEKNKLKHDCYYAFVEADGDGMGAYIKGLGNDITGFSQCVFDYADEAAELIGAFGGMTVYAGGDDLMFIAPVCGWDDKTVFDLCREISEVFTKAIENIGDVKAKRPTVSFGIAIRRESFPLYEALKSSLNALFMAKSDAVGKNAMVIDLQKGSGQALKIAIPFDEYEIFEKVFRLYSDKDENLLKSAIYVFNERKTMFEYKPLTSEIIENIINNTFDNAEQKKSEGFIKGLSAALVEFLGEDEKKINAYENNKECVPIKTFEALLRLSKFMIEKKGAEDNEQIPDKADSD